MNLDGIANPFGAAAFEKVAWPMPELQLFKQQEAERTARRRSRRLRAPKPPSQILKNFLLSYDK